VYYSKDVSANGRITLELILEKYGGMLWIGCIWIRIGTSHGFL